MASERRFKEPRFRVGGVLVALLLVGGILDVTTRPSAPSYAAVNPVRNAETTLSSTWYCTGQSAAANGAANGALVVSNLGGRPLAGTLTEVTNDARSAVVDLAVPALSRLVVGQPEPGMFVADRLTFDSGSVLVGEAVSGPLGRSSAPCSPTTSSQWYLSGGSTLQGDQLLTFLYNPASTDVVADMTFATDQGPASPGDFQGILVPSNSLVVVDVGSHVIDRREVATTVSARMGRLVVYQLAERAAMPPAAQSLVLGAPATGSSWFFPSGFNGVGISEAYEIYNPSSSPADVQMDLSLASGSAEPIRTEVGSGSVVTVQAAGEPRIPVGVSHSAHIWSTNGVGIVAQRSLSAQPPALQAGRSEMIGATGPSTTSSFYPGSIDAAPFAQSLTFQRQGEGTALVGVYAVSGGHEQPLPGLVGLGVSSRAPLSVQVPATLPVNASSLVVRSTLPVIAERDGYAVGSSGTSAVTGLG